MLLLAISANTFPAASAKLPWLLPRTTYHSCRGVRLPPDSRRHRRKHPTVVMHLAFSFPPRQVRTDGDRVASPDVGKHISTRLGETTMSAPPHHLQLLRWGSSASRLSTPPPKHPTVVMQHLALMHLGGWLLLPRGLLLRLVLAALTLLSVGACLQSSLSAKPSYHTFARRHIIPHEPVSTRECS